MSVAPDGLPGTRCAAVLLAAMLAWTAWEMRPTAVTAAPDMRIDVNAASATRLAILPGIGPALAGRIAADRTERGPFASVGEIERVEGIGPRKLEMIEPHVTIESSAP